MNDLIEENKVCKNVSVNLITEFKRIYKMWNKNDYKHCNIRIEFTTKSLHSYEHVCVKKKKPSFNVQKHT